MDEKATVLCYNKGCGQRFDPSKNDQNDCIHHPGVPVFHDAYKGWSCCTKKTTDFTEFLNIKGCARSCHNNVKPAEVPKEVVNSNVEVKEVLSVDTAPCKPKTVGRPSDTETLTPLMFTVTSSLKSELIKLGERTKDNSSPNLDSMVVQFGTSCKNGGCTKNYEKESDNTETCMHHPGVPVFHEGMKFWTCCTRRTTDFNNFLEQAGCTAGNHLWIKPKSPNDKKLSCRYDWYQTGPNVFVTIYCKVPIPDKSNVEANKVRLHVYIVFGEESNEFEIDLPLFGVIDCGNSTVQFAGNKVEIKLKKDDALKWSSLTLKESEIKSPIDNLQENLDDSLRL